MQAVMETLFDIVYLSTVITLGVLMLKNARGNAQYTLYGIMAVCLGCGDAFHLVPRAWALCTDGLPPTRPRWASASSSPPSR